MECARCSSVGWEPRDDGLCPYCQQIVKLEDEVKRLKAIIEPDEKPAYSLKGRLLNTMSKVVNYATYGHTLTVDDLFGISRLLWDAAMWVKKTSNAVRVERMALETGGYGCRFIVGDDHVVAEWRGDGISADTIFVEDTALTYFKTTTPFHRCVRMAMEMAHWEVVSAMLKGPGDGKLVEWGERYRPDMGEEPEAFVRRLYGLGVHLIDRVGGRDHVLSADEAVTLARSDWSGSHDHE